MGRYAVVSCRCGTQSHSQVSIPYHPLVIFHSPPLFFSATFSPSSIRLFIMSYLALGFHSADLTQFFCHMLSPLAVLLRLVWSRVQQRRRLQHSKFTFFFRITTI